jgi:arginine utilization protein RocB
MILSIATLFFFFKIIANKNEHTSSVLVNLANKMAKRENIDTLKKKIEEVKQTQEKINEHFVDSTKIDSFVDYLEKLGTSGSTEVKVESFELSVADKNTLQVKLSTKGTFSNVMRTMMLLENTPYHVAERIRFLKSDIMLYNDSILIATNAAEDDLKKTRHGILVS